MEIMKQKVIDRRTGESIYDEVYDRRMIIYEDDYKRLLKALRTSSDPSARELAREMFLLRTHLRRCDKCGTVSYTTKSVAAYPNTAGLSKDACMCAWCASKVFPKIVTSPARYGYPAQIRTRRDNAYAEKG